MKYLSRNLFTCLILSQTVPYCLMELAVFVAENREVSGTRYHGRLPTFCGRKLLRSIAFYWLATIIALRYKKDKFTVFQMGEPWSISLKT